MNTLEMPAATTLPYPVRVALLSTRNALVRGDINEAYHALYTIVDPDFQSYRPWKKLIDSIRKDYEQYIKEDAFSLNETLRLKTKTELDFDSAINPTLG